uniref:Uncharacterized protein n=1 Tax=Medicago truncatula TaxID=3880 RepID=A2Q4F9_MEDTR|nr:hypothetical protein MtrDRAFT_AC157473g27v2 [Medicago truncatula]
MTLFGRVAGFSKPKDTNTNKQAMKNTGGIGLLNLWTMLSLSRE